MTGPGRVARSSRALAPWIASALVHGLLGLTTAMLVRRSMPQRADLVTSSAAPAAIRALLEIDTSPIERDTSMPDTSALQAARPLGQARFPSGEVLKSLRPARATRASTVARVAEDPRSLEPAPPQAPASDASAVAAEARPRLSLAELGVGFSNPFRAIDLAPGIVPSAEERVQAALQHDALAGARQHQVGPEGPVVEAAQRLAFARDTLVDARAVLSVRADASGHVTNVDVLEASSSPLEWRRLADELLKALASTVLHLPAATRGTQVKLQVLTAMRLPSGADPGTRLDLFGLTLREGGGPRSTSLSLSPKPPLELEEPQDSAGRHLHMPLQFAAGLLQLKGDPADIAAAPRRVVEVSVLSVEALRAQ